MKPRTGGADTYTLRSTTLVENYMPGPMRQNLLMDPDRALGKNVLKNFGNDYMQNGPGTMSQAIPNIPNHNYQYSRVFAVPTGNPYRNFAPDDRQTATYLVEQLNKNPLSQYSDNPNGEIPRFECASQPDNFSTMVSNYETEYYKYFEQDFPVNNLISTQQVYHQYTGREMNPNASIVYNMSVDYEGRTNPMISLGSSRRIAEPEYSGKCYSGNSSGIKGCDRSVKFANPLVLN